LEPLVLRCRILAPYVPLRATSSKSVPSVDIVYITQRSVTKTEFRNYLVYKIIYILLCMKVYFNTGIAFLKSQKIHTIPF